MQLFQLRLSRAKRKSRIRARKAAGNRYENPLICKGFPTAFRARIRLFRFARGQP
jgi:hypothetical protein